MVTEYFVIFGVLFAAYCIFRIFVWGQYQLDFRPLPPEKTIDSPGKSIDAAPLSNRLQEVREHHEIRPPSQSTSFKQSLLVESRREKLAQSDYFRKPAPPEKPEDEHPGLTVILV